MKRQRIRNAEYRQLLEQTNDDENNADAYEHRQIQMQNQRQRAIRRENVLEAQIQPGDTLQAIALRYNCTISDLKRLNKIEKEIEIHARKTLKVPVNAHTILLNTNGSDELPIVHKSGQNSPKHPNSSYELNNISDSSITNQINSIDSTSHIQLLPNNIHSLDEKLLVASVSLASSSGSSLMQSKQTQNINDTILKSDIVSRNVYRDNKHHADDNNDSDDETRLNDPLLMHLNDSSTTTRDVLRSGPHAIRGAPRNDFSCSGSDCDISWICLFVCILALCFAIPLIYVIYIAEHPEQFNNKESDFNG